MPFIGTTPTQGFVSSFPKQSFTPNGTTLTMSEAPATGLNFYVINKSFAQVTTTPPLNSISADRITSNAVTTAKIASNAVTSAKLDTNIAVGGNLTVSGTFDSPSAWKLVDTQTGSSTSAGNVLLGTLSTSYKKHKIFYRIRFTQGGSSNILTVYQYWGSGVTLRGGFQELTTNGTFTNPLGYNGGYAQIGNNVAAASSGYDMSGEMLVTQNHAGGGYHAYLNGWNTYTRSGTGPVGSIYYSQLNGTNSFTTFHINCDETAGSGVAFTYDVEVYGWN